MKSFIKSQLSRFSRTDRPVFQPLELCVTHYYRGKDANNKAKRFHRAIFVITDPASKDTPHGTVFQVIHGRPIFEYMTKADTDITLRQMEKYSGKITIGEVQRGDLDVIEEILQGVNVVRDINSDWSCQAWTRDGVRKLVERGFVDKAVGDQLDGELTRAETAFIAELDQRYLRYHSRTCMQSYFRHPLARV
jgi:hypothetical protein